MKINVTVKPRAKRTVVEKIGPAEFRVSVTVPPHAGEATLAVARALAEYFHCPTSAVRLVVGRTNRRKVFEINSSA